MAQCKWCGKKGFFLSVDRAGLCQTCSPSVAMAASEHARVIKSSSDVIAKSKNWKTKLSRCDLILEHLQELLAFEEKGIQTMQPPPSKLIATATADRINIVREGATEAVEKALADAELATTPRTQVNKANKAVLAVGECRKEIGDDEVLDELETKARQFGHQAQLNGYLDAARKAEFKGNKKKALDQYQEALYFLRTDDVDDSHQSDQLAEIEAKISELQQDLAG